MQRAFLTTGSQQALNLIAHTLIDPGDVVAVELPTYIGGTSIRGQKAEGRKQKCWRSTPSAFCFLPSAFVEDDPYGELVYVPGADTTSIHSRDRDGRVLYLGTFSKILAPGMRCGWIAAAKELIERFEIAKQAADLCSGMLDQSIVDEYCNAGELPAQIERVRSGRPRMAACLPS